MSETTTKERILKAAEEIMLAKSFHAVGLNEILSAVKVPKGSFYHYFESKEQFGVEMLKHYLGEHQVKLEKFMAQEELDPLERLLSFFDFATNKMLEADCKPACLTLKLASECSCFSEAMREVMADGMRQQRAVFERVFRDGQKQKVILKNLDPGSTVALIQDTWQGAMHRMQLEHSVAPLRAASAFFRKLLTV